MTKGWRIFLPYCLEQLGTGEWVVLNRLYKPLGWSTKDHLNYEDARIPRYKVPPQTLAKLVRLGATRTKQNLHLYDDGTAPNLPANWERYACLLQALANLTESI